MSGPSYADDLTDVTCPFCGLLCDDLGVERAGARLAITTNGCSVARAGFARATKATTARPMVRGRPAELEVALAEAARLLGAARLPLLAGLGTDVEGARALMRLADRCGAVLDHMNSPSTLRNLLVLQDTGWITTTLSEVRNHCDLLVVVGDSLTNRFPRILERTIGARDTMFEDDRTVAVVSIGAPLPDGSSQVIPCETNRLGEAFGALRALIAGRPLDAAEVAGVPMSTWAALAGRMREARYGVLAWAASEFDFPHAELTIQCLAETIKDLNAHTRFSGLPLAGTDGDLTMDAVQTWQTGFGSRTSLAGESPEYDPYRFNARALLDHGEADLLVWVSSLDGERQPPPTEVPTIVLGQAGVPLEREPEVYFPVGTPGVDHAGHLFRTDRVVTMPLVALRPSELPTVASVVTALADRLGAA